MTNVIMLVVWLSLDASQPPAFQVLALADSVKQCESVKAQLVRASPEAKGKVACMQILTPLKDASHEF